MHKYKRVLLNNCLTADALDIDLSVLGYTFETKPLLIGGKAKEYYGIREAGADIDFVITPRDYELLSAKYPGNIKEIWGDFGVYKYGFEIWKSICLLEYDFYAEDAIEEEDYLVISFEKLMFMMVLAMRQPKYLNDLRLMRDRMGRINSLVHS